MVGLVQAEPADDAVYSPLSGAELERRIASSKPRVEKWARIVFGPEHRFRDGQLTANIEHAGLALLTRHALDHCR